MWGLGTTLIVDDSDVYRRLPCMLLEPFSEKVLDAANSAAAIALIDTESAIRAAVDDADRMR